MIKKLSLFLILFLACFFVGCAKTNEREVFRFEAHQLELEIGEQIEIRLIMGSVSKDEEIEYKVNTEGVIKLEGNIVKAIGVGVAKVTAQVKNIPTTRATVEITVTDKKLSALKINGESRVEVKKSLDLTVETIPSEISNDVTWSSSDTNIATVDANGKVETYKPGIVTISATSKYDPTLVAKKEIEVTYLDAQVIDLEFTSGTEDVIYQESSTLKATVYPDSEKKYPELTNQTVTWTSSNPSIATVKDGVITPVKVSGESDIVEITATSFDGKASKTVAIKVVYDKIDKIEITHKLEVLELFEGNKATLGATVTPKNANQAITWESSDPELAEVDKDGVVTANKKGKVTIKAIGADGVTFGELELTIIGVPDPEKIEVLDEDKNPVGNTLEITEWDTFVLRVTVLPDGAKQDFEVISSNTDVLSVKLVRGIYEIYGEAAGEATITITSTVNPEIKYTINVKVNPLE